MTSFIQLDTNLVRAASSLTERSHVVAFFTYIAAEVLILVFPVALLALWYQPELTSHKHAARKAVILALMGVVGVLAIKGVASLLWVRERPFVADPTIFHLALNLDQPSFPSGHTMVAVVIAASLLWSGFKKWGIPLSILAVLVALGRVFAGVHYPSDVVGGALIAIFVAWFLHREAGTLKRYLPDD